MWQRNHGKETMVNQHSREENEQLRKENETLKKQLSLFKQLIRNPQRLNSVLRRLEERASQVLPCKTHL